MDSLASTRTRRVIRKPLTYWEEYVATDVWYQNEIVRDIPVNERHAAFVDEDLNDVGCVSDSLCISDSSNSDLSDVDTIEELSDVESTIELTSESSLELSPESSPSSNNVSVE